MIWNEHSDLKGCHAFLSPSNYYFIDYNEEKLITSWDNRDAAALGTEIHEFASTCIKLGQKLEHSKKTLNMFVNDAIGYKMRSEQVLFYSDICYGTADAIVFRNNMLRVHDLKTGKIPANIKQLLIYAALFCLEYKVKPEDIKTELRIYQNNEVLVYIPEPLELSDICKKIVESDKSIKSHIAEVKGAFAK